MRDAIREGGVHTGRIIPFRGRGESCPRCGTAMARDTIGGRTTYWCPTLPARLRRRSAASPDCAPGRPIVDPRRARLGGSGGSMGPAQSAQRPVSWSSPWSTAKPAAEAARSAPAVSTGRVDVLHAAAAAADDVVVGSVRAS